MFSTGRMPTDRTPTAAVRLERMRRSFEKERSILAEDYEFFPEYSCA
jgi:hypothetical protein